MRSQLTLPIIRRLLDGRPITHNGCLCRRYHISRNRRANYPRPTVLATQYRTLFSSYFRPPQGKEGRGRDVFPGLDVLQKLSRAEMLDSRRPEEGQLRGALRQFFEEKQKRKGAIDEVVAGHLLRTFSWLQRQAESSQETSEGSDTSQSNTIAKSWLDLEDARKAVELLMQVEANSATQTHQELALLLRDSIMSTTIKNDMGTGASEQDVMNNIRMLSAVGRPMEARDLLFSLLDSASPITTAIAQEALRYVLGSLNHHNFPEGEIEATEQLMARREIRHTSATRSELVKYYAHRDDLKRAVQQLEMPAEGQDREADLSAIVAVLESCMRLKDEQVGRAILGKHLENHSNSPQMWTCVFQFASAVGRGADEVDRMMTVMEKRAASTSSKPALLLDVGMLNSLVKFAMDRQDPYLAERFIALGQKRGVEPNALTFLYQMSYRLSVDDVDGAIAAYEQARGLPADDEDVLDKDRHGQEISAINALIQAMCKVERRYPFETIMRIVDDLNDKPNTYFQAATVAKITILHLRREEYYDVVDLLKLHTANYNVSERHIVRDAMVSYCFDLRNSVARVWDCYQIFRQLLDAETPREVRTAIMNEFYKRRRADMGYHVFSHMRDSPDSAVRANKDTYADALVGIAKCKDEETLEFVHNQLKLDPQIDLDTRLSNALMLAYIGIGQPSRAITFWEDVVSSREGPSYNSILIAFRACEETPFGIEQGNIIWERLLALDIEVTREVFTAWCACLAGNGFIKELEGMLQRADEFGIKFDSWMLGSIFNAAGHHPHGQNNSLMLLKRDFPELTDQVLAMPRRRQRNGSVRFSNIDRTLVP